MRSLTYDEITKILVENNIEHIPTFVETGTYKGGTIFPLSLFFTNLYTIEINENAYIYCCKIANKKRFNNINFFLGDSSIKMIDVVDELNRKELMNVVFFLDGHVTDNNSGFTGKGKKDVPVLEELTIISNNYKGNGIIIIDDTRLLNKIKSDQTANADWSNITLESMLSNFNDKRIVKSYFTLGGGKQKEKDDRYIIHFKNI